MYIVNEPKTTKTRIFEAAVELFAARGYHGTSIRDLAKKVGIKESSIYNHFPGKAAILQAIMDYQMEGFQNSLKALDNLKAMNLEFTDPIEFWLAGTEEFLKHQPPLNEPVSRIIINEMFLNEQCRDFVVNKQYKAQKELTLTILTAMRDMGLIRDCNINMAAQQYVYMIQGLEMENKLLMLQGQSEKESIARLIEHMRFFMDALRK